MEVDLPGSPATLVQTRGLKHGLPMMKLSWECEALVTRRAFPKVRYWGSKIARLYSAFAGSDLARVKTKSRFCLHTAMPWSAFCRDCFV